MGRAAARPEMIAKETDMSATTTRNEINGIDVTGLNDSIERLKGNPHAAMTHWSVTSRWAGGTRSDHAIDGFGIGDRRVDRHFTLGVDEPVELGGTNQFANPQEYLLSAMNACMIVGYAAVSALMGVKLSRLEIRTTGDIDLRGFLGIDSSVAAGYESLEQTVTIAGDGTAEQLRRIHETVKKTSPNYFNITRAIATQTRLVME